MRSNVSRGTSLGMRRWYRTKVPRCAACKKTHLISYRRREKKLCAKCEKEQWRQIKAIKYDGAMYSGRAKWNERGLVPDKRYTFKPLYTGGALVGDKHLFMEDFYDIQRIEV